MTHGFYDLLGVDRKAEVSEIRAAYHRRLAELVRRLRAARRQGADVSILEAQERALREAKDVLCDEQRRRRYDAYLHASVRGMPDDAEAMWQLIRGAEVDPVTAAALSVVRALTDLEVTDPFPELTAEVERPEPPPERSSARAPLPERTTAATEPGVPPAITLPPPSLVAASRVAAPIDPVEADFGLHDGPAARLPDLDPDDYDAPVIEISPAARAPAAPRDPIDALVDRFGTDGRFLRAVRELRGQSIDGLAQTTRISERYLEALEANQFDHLPAATFVRGYLKELVRVLDVADRDVVEGYMALFSRARG